MAVILLLKSCKPVLTARPTRAPVRLPARRVRRLLFVKKCAASARIHLKKPIGRESATELGARVSRRVRWHAPKSAPMSANERVEPLRGVELQEPVHSSLKSSTAMP